VTLILTDEPNSLATTSVLQSEIPFFVFVPP
jgi:hypothetical protein